MQARPSPPTQRAVLRAPPLVDALGADVRGQEFDEAAQDHLVRTVRLWSACAAGAAWTGILAGLLFGLGRVPVPETLAWSLLAGLAVARVAHAMTDRAVRWMLEPVQVELSLSDPATYRDAFAQRAARWGLDTKRCSLTGCRLRPTWAPARAVAPLVAEWVGPGVRLTGPRFAVRAAMRWALP